MTEGKRKRARDIAGIVGVWVRTIFPIATFVIAVLFATQVVSVSVYPQIESPEIPDVNVDFPSNMTTKGWHQSHRGGVEISSDYTLPFYIRGEEAMVSWTPFQDTSPGIIAYLCLATESDCTDRDLQREEMTLYEIVTEPDPQPSQLNEGWYVIRMDGSSGFVEVYLFY